MDILFIHKALLGRFGTAAINYFPAILSKQGHHVTIMAKRGGDSSFVASSGVCAVEVENDLKWYSTLLNVIKKTHPDIIHVFIHAGCGLYPYVDRSNISKYVLDIRSPLLHAGFTRKLVQFKNRFEVRCYDAVAAHGIESAKTVIGDQRDVCWLPPGIDLSVIAEKKIVNHISGDQPLRLIYIGSLRKLRKITRMVKAVIIASQKVTLQLDIYGDGDGLSDIEQVVREHDAASTVYYKGIIPREILFDRLSDYDIALSYVPKGLYDPAPPLKTIEYLACGLPTIATNTSGNAMIIQDGLNGILVGEDPTTFSKGILKLANDEELRFRLARNARLSIVDFDWNQIVENKLIPLYQQLIDNPDD